jgi:hypothetical protein
METLITVTGEFKAKWEDLSSSVRSQFSLPAARLVCCFGNEPHLDPVCPESWRGVFRPIKARGNGDWPSYIRCEFPRQDALIYLPGSTCSTNDDVLFVMAYAHELRHFEQWDGELQLLRDCESLSNEPNLATKKLDAPHERDAIGFSKKVAIELLGPDRVEKYARDEVRGGNDISYWEFFQALPPSADYDWIEAGRRFVAEHWGNGRGFG